MTLPDLDELVALRAAAQGLALRGRGPARAARQGVHASAHRGRGLEFQEVRPYVPGDDPRTIDWRVTARRGRPHTKLYREERERAVWLLADLNPSLFFGTRGQLKSASLVRCAALLAWVATLGGDRVGAVVAASTSRCRIFAPRAREAGVLPLLAALIELQPRHPAAAEPDNLNGALGTLVALVQPGSLILLLSDFADADQTTETLCSQLAAHGECRLFWMTDPLEQQGLPDGRFRAGFPDRARFIDGADVRPQWVAAWQARTAAIEQLARRSLAPVGRVDTSEPADHALRQLLPQGRFAA